LHLNSGVIQLTVNGEPRQFDREITVSQLLETMALANKRVALERNGEIVPRSHYAEQRLTHGDQLEIVVAVRGG
jgi:sulfur carrier protein